jgi:hypothetical protein
MLTENMVIVIARLRKKIGYFPDGIKLFGPGSPDVNGLLDFFLWGTGDH